MDMDLEGFVIEVINAWAHAEARFQPIDQGEIPRLAEKHGLLELRGGTLWYACPAFSALEAKHAEKEAG